MIIYLVLLSKIIVDQNKISISYTMLVSPEPKHLVFVCVLCFYHIYQQFLKILFLISFFGINFCHLFQDETSIKELLISFSDGHHYQDFVPCLQNAEDQPRENALDIEKQEQ